MGTVAVEEKGLAKDAQHPVAKEERNDVRHGHGLA